MTSFSTLTFFFDLSETFLEAKLDAVKFKDYVLRWVPAIRTSATGRASGGMLYC